MVSYECVVVTTSERETVRMERCCVSRSIITSPGNDDPLFLVPALPYPFTELTCSMVERCTELPHLTGDNIVDVISGRHHGRFGYPCEGVRDSMDQRHVGEFEEIHDLQPFMQLIVRLHHQGAVRSYTDAILDCLIQQRSQLSGIKRPSIPTKLLGER